MKRVPEPDELMNDAAQALAYAEADFSEANTLFVRLFEQHLPRSPAPGLRVLDLGCGPGDIPLELLRRHADMSIDAVDGAPAMLDLARQASGADAGLQGRLNLICETLPSMRLAQGRYAAVISNSLLHHLADPMDLWLTIGHCARSDALVLVMDLARPPSELAVDSLVESYALEAPEVLRRDFRNSLLAAYTPHEVRVQLRRAGWKKVSVDMVSDRHWAAWGRPGA
jgi:SAM-dependent methyltransferase